MATGDLELSHRNHRGGIKHEFPLSFALSGADKDAHLIADAAKAAGLPDVLSRAFAATFDQAVNNAENAGGADNVDFAAVVLGLEKSPDSTD